jgi:hypothetical protein
VVESILPVVESILPLPKWKISHQVIVPEPRRAALLYFVMDRLERRHPAGDLRFDATWIRPTTCNKHKEASSQLRLRRGFLVSLILENEAELETPSDLFTALVALSSTGFQPKQVEK